MSGPPPPPRKKRLQEKPEIVEFPSRPNPKTYVKQYLHPDLDNVPETCIGKGVQMKGDLHFDRLLRIDGSFVGTLHSSGNVIVGETGSFKGDISNLKTILIDGGRIEGNINVDSVIAINRATIIGNITCKSISCDKYVTIRGRMNIHSLAPELIDSNGEIVLDAEELNAHKIVIKDSQEVVDNLDMDDMSHKKLPSMSKSTIDPNSGVLNPASPVVVGADGTAGTKDSPKSEDNEEEEESAAPQPQRVDEKEKSDKTNMNENIPVEMLTTTVENEKIDAAVEVKQEQSEDAASSVNDEEETEVPQNDDDNKEIPLDDGPS